MTPDAAHQRESITVTIKADTRSLRRGLIEAELSIPRRLRRRAWLHRLSLRYKLWKVKREAAP